LTDTFSRELHSERPDKALRLVNGHGTVPWGPNQIVALRKARQGIETNLPEAFALRFRSQKPLHSERPDKALRLVWAFGGFSYRNDLVALRKARQGIETSDSNSSSVIHLVALRKARQGTETWMLGLRMRARDLAAHTRGWPGGPRS
jgi:hypothetical protein